MRSTVPDHAAQSALLEAMQERQVTTDGVITRLLARPFLVLATQNPIELEGTFPLPEAQVDRFLLRLALGYPSQMKSAPSCDVFAIVTHCHPCNPCFRAEQVLELGSRLPPRCTSHVALEDYMLALVAATRRHEAISLGPVAWVIWRSITPARPWRPCTGATMSCPTTCSVCTAVLAHRLILNAQGTLCAAKMHVPPCRPLSPCARACRRELVSGLTGEW